MKRKIGVSIFALLALGLLGACNTTPLEPTTTAQPQAIVRKPALDFDGDGKADFNNKNLSGVWTLDYSTNGFGAKDANHAAYGGREAFPTPADYDGDGKTDLSVKTTDGAWLIDFAANGFGAWNARYSSYGGLEAFPVPADYDGDGKADLSVKTTGGAWLIDYARDGFGAWNQRLGSYGGPEAVPTPADYDGDGKTDLSVKTTGGAWLIDYASDGFGVWNQRFGAYGGPEADPVPADYDGDGKADLSVKTTDGQWLIDFARDGFGTWNLRVNAYGSREAIPVPADYDGDGKADLSVKTTGGLWLVDYASNGFGAWNATLNNYGPAYNHRLSALTINVSNGNVSNGIVGLNCSSNCTNDYMVGADLTLVATPAQGYVFSAWTGACVGSGECRPVLSGDATVGATFVPANSNQCPPEAACSRFTPAELDRFVDKCKGLLENSLTLCLTRETGDPNVSRFLFSFITIEGHWQCTEWVNFVAGVSYYGDGKKTSRLVDYTGNLSLVGSAISTKTSDGNHHTAIIRNVFRNTAGRIVQVEVWDANWVGPKAPGPDTNGSGQLGIHSLTVTGNGGVADLNTYYFIR